jgi:radical SAM protein with 4Fe4S-binding SPASM domain
MRGVKHTTVNGMRLHLRRDAHQNLLWINSSHLLILNRMAALLVENYIDVMNESQTNFNDRTVLDRVIANVALYYPKENDLEKHFQKLFGEITEIARGKCPVIDSGLEFKELGIRKWSAPARMDLALTYKCNNKCYYCYMGGNRKTDELSKEEWVKVLAKLWRNGIPQVVFTGGEPTLYKDLVYLVDNAQEFVTGLVTNGRQLNRVFCHELRLASLDYAQISIESWNLHTHDAMTGVDGSWADTLIGIRNALDEGLHISTNTTIMPENIDETEELVEFLAKLGVKDISFNSLICSGKGYHCKGSKIDDETLYRALQGISSIANELKVNVQWYSPSCYKKLNPISLGLGVKNCSASKFNMTIEPWGNVIPCQSWMQESCGDILKDNWKKIWNSRVAKKARNPHLMKECGKCEWVTYCEGGCPLERI